MALEFWFLMSIHNYYTIFYDRYARLVFKSPKVMIPFILIIGINYFIFDYKDRWKDYVAVFDQWPKRKNTSLED